MSVMASQLGAKNVPLAYSQSRRLLHYPNHSLSREEANLREGPLDTSSHVELPSLCPTKNVVVDSNADIRPCLEVATKMSTLECVLRIKYSETYINVVPSFTSIELIIYSFFVITMAVELLHRVPHAHGRQ